MVMLWAGFWQLGRADEKAEINTRLAGSNINQPILSADWDKLHAFDQVKISGQYANLHFLLDNQIIDGQVGHFVFSAFETAEGIRLLINRGWVTDVQQDFEVNNNEVAVSALVADWPRPGIQLGEQTVVNEVIQHVTYLPKQQVHELLKLRLCSEPVDSRCQVLPVVLKLNPQMEYGYVRKWQLPRMTAEKHRAYAVQWFTMSLVLCFIYVIFIRKNYSS